MIVRFQGGGAPGEGSLVMRRLDGAGIEGPLARFGAGFAQWLLSQGYTRSSVDHHLGLMGWLSRWLVGTGLGADAVSEVVVHRFRTGPKARWRWAADSGAGTVAGISSPAGGGRVAGVGDGPVGAARCAVGI